jgi:hypothetical protein
MQSDCSYPSGQHRATPKWLTGAMRRWKPDSILWKILSRRRAAEELLFNAIGHAGNSWMDHFQFEELGQSVALVCHVYKDRAEHYRGELETFCEKCGLQSSIGESSYSPDCLQISIWPLPN